MPDLDEVLLALAHPARREALKMLGEGCEICLCEFIDRLGVAQPNMSRHMSVLRRVELVTDRRDARWVRYRLNDAAAAHFKAVMETVLSAHSQIQTETHPAETKREAAE